mmetsp:Transcript_5198/g.12344  ORF Transcript_5198/g.12344 Transcript_5198/m.12344 type:complete len:230 (+) Transcript_5198:479-1168(+)
MTYVVGTVCRLDSPLTLGRCVISVHRIPSAPKMTDEPPLGRTRSHTKRRKRQPPATQPCWRPLLTQRRDRWRAALVSFASSPNSSPTLRSTRTCVSFASPLLLSHFRRPPSNDPPDLPPPTSLDCPAPFCTVSARRHSIEHHATRHVLCVLSPLSGTLLSPLPRRLPFDGLPERWKYAPSSAASERTTMQRRGPNKGPAVSGSVSAFQRGLVRRICFSGSVGRDPGRGL